MTYSANQLDPRDYELLTQNQERLKFLIKFATLAPSSHNTQPWEFSITDNSIIVRPNQFRRLKISDDKDRFLFISLGACLLNLETASKAYGLDYMISNIGNYTLNETSIKYSYPSLVTSKAVDYSSLFNIINRQTNRLPYKQFPLPSRFKDEVKKFILPEVFLSFFESKSDKEQLIEITNKSIRAAYSNPKFREELSNWIKPSLMRYELGMPGYTILVPFILSFLLPWIIKKFNISKMQEKMHRDWIINTSACAVLSSEDDNFSWIQVGKTYEAIALYAEQIGLKTAILGAPTQIGEHYLDIQKLTKNNKRPQLFFRIGFAKKLKRYSPRLDPEKVIL